MDRIGAAFKRRRKLRDLTQASLAKAAGVSRATIIDIEKGTSEHSHSLLMRVARALGADNVAAVVGEHATATEKAPVKLSREIEQIVTKYERTTIDGRQALIALVRALPDAEVDEGQSAQRRSPRGPRE